MALNLPDTENIFPHSKEFKWGGGNIRPGQATIVVARDGSGDTSSIQEGIDLLPNDGGVVYVKEGEYQSSESIVINKNDVALVGTGKGTKLIQVSNKRVIFAASQSGITIRDLWIYGTAGTGNNIQDGIRLNDCSNCIIENCWIEHNDVDGIIITGVALTNCVISNCRAYSNDNDGIKITSYSPVLIIGNICWSNGAHGIEVSSADYVLIANNDCYANTASGIHLVTADYNIINGNSCTTNDVGINVSNAGCDENTLMGNIVRNNSTSQVSDSGTNTEIINKQIDIDHASITNTHNLTTDIDHDSITNTHNLTTDIVHDDITAGTIADHDTSATGAELDTLTDGSNSDALHGHEGTAIISTGEGGGTKFLREDGDDSCSWQAAPATGDVTAAINLTADTIVQGDDGAKGVKTSTVTVTEVAANTTHRGDSSNPHGELLTQTELSVTTIEAQDITAHGDLIVDDNATISGTIINTDFTTLTDTSDADALHVHSLADTHIADGTKHFIEAAITHDNIIAGTIASHDTSATGAELDTLTDGSDSSALHVHTIVSLDTDTTGAELTSLADNSMVDTLHRHSELSASDGTPDAALQVDAAGNVGIGVADPHSKLEVAGAISSSIVTIAASADGTDVSGANTLVVGTAGGNVVLGGLSGGVIGQYITIIKATSVNTLTLENNEATGTQKFLMHTGVDETLHAGDYGGYTFVFTGTFWYDCGHAKHT